MALTEADVRHVALLARLALTEEQIESLRCELTSILSHIEAIRRLDLTGIEPTAHPVPMVNVSRTDDPTPGLRRELALLNAPESEDGAFVIPRIVGPGGEQG